jgi:hypothetical protein
MPHQYTGDEVADRGEEIYQREIRDLVEPEHTGEFLVLDILTGGYVIDADEVSALRRARAAYPDGVRYLKRVGFRTAHRIGARVSKSV